MSPAASRAMLSSLRDRESLNWTTVVVVYTCSQYAYIRTQPAIRSTDSAKMRTLCVFVCMCVWVVKQRHD